MVTLIPVGVDAHFIIEKSKNGQRFKCLYNDGRKERVIAVSSTLDTKEEFEWLVRSAAAFHKIAVKNIQGV